MRSRQARVVIPHSEHWDIQSHSGDHHIIQLSRPLHWQESDISAENQAPVIYIVDGNVLFTTATDGAWRRATGPHYSGGGIPVVTGYPLKRKVYDKRPRAFDLTPPCLFVLHALCTTLSLFDCYMASSPIIELADYHILKEEKERGEKSLPHGEAQEHYNHRMTVAAARGTGNNIKNMHQGVQDSAKLVCVMACAISRALTTFFEQWPLDGK
ncbi:hypothetical protein BDW62DRAFT_209953 [Aspergillus aurantiobrunneus]